MKLLSRVWLLATPWTAAYQAPPSMGFYRQEYWSGVPLHTHLLITIIILFHKTVDYVLKYIINYFYGWTLLSLALREEISKTCGFFKMQIVQQNCY